jgi:phosphoenolpyruvate synthase/pyruvate phosphate dikinase
LAEASFAGQLDTVLNIAPYDHLRAVVRHCRFGSAGRRSRLW